MVFIYIKQEGVVDIDIEMDGVLLTHVRILVVVVFFRFKKQLLLLLLFCYVIDFTIVCRCLCEYQYVSWLDVVNRE